MNLGWVAIALIFGTVAVNVLMSSTCRRALPHSLIVIFATLSMGASFYLFARGMPVSDSAVVWFTAISGGLGSAIAVTLVLRHLDTANTGPPSEK